MSGGCARAAYLAALREHWPRMLLSLPLFPLVLIAFLLQSVMWLVTGSS